MKRTQMNRPEMLRVVICPVNFVRFEGIEPKETFLFYEALIRNLFSVYLSVRRCKSIESDIFSSRTNIIGHNQNATIKRDGKSRQLQTKPNVCVCHEEMSAINVFLS